MPKPPIGSGPMDAVWRKAVSNQGLNQNPEARLSALADSPTPPPGDPPPIKRGEQPEAQQTETKPRTTKKTKTIQPVQGPDRLSDYKQQSTEVAFVIPGMGMMKVPAVTVEESETALCIVFDLNRPGATFVPDVGATVEMYAGNRPHKVYYPGSKVTLEGLGLMVLMFIKTGEDIPFIEEI